MIIQSVRIKNFRALKDVTVPFENVTTFIGPNGAGKSTVLRALDWFFNGKAGALKEQDCSYGFTDEPIEVAVTFSDLTEQDRQALGKYAPAGATTFTAWKRRSADGSEVLSANAKGLPDFNTIKLASTASERKERYSTLRSHRPELELPAAATGPAVDQAIAAWEASHANDLVDVPESLQTNFFGFNSAGKMSGLFDFVLVAADLRASEEAVDGKSSILGRILERSIDRSAADEEIAQVVENARLQQQQIYQDKFKGQLDLISQSLNQVVSSFTAGREIKVTPSDVELKAPRTTFEVSVLDGMTETAIERQGHGFQRTLLVSALQMLAQSGAASAEGTICLAIEEPELFQHPIQAQAFAQVLRTLADDATKRMQVAYATHSPYFLEPRHFAQIRRLVRKAPDNPIVDVRFTAEDEVKALLQGTVEPGTVDSQLDAVITEKLSIALFADRVLLVEGTTDSAVLRGVADRIDQPKLEALGIAVVAVGGKTNIALPHAILVGLGIPAYAVFDSDEGFAERAKRKGKDEKKIEEERISHVKANRALLKYFNLPETDFPDAIINAAVAILPDTLETLLHEAWPEWHAACLELEQATSVKPSKNHQAYRIATRRAKGSPPKILLDILARVRALQA